METTESVRFLVTVEAPSKMQAHRVMAERLEHFEDYDFEYSITWQLESVKTEARALIDPDLPGGLSPEAARLAYPQDFERYGHVAAWNRDSTDGEAS